MMPEVALLVKRGWLPLIMRLVFSQCLYLGTVGIVQSHGRTDGNTHKLVHYSYVFFIFCTLLSSITTFSKWSMPGCFNRSRCNKQCRRLQALRLQRRTSWRCGENQLSNPHIRKICEDNYFYSCRRTSYQWDRGDWLLSCRGPSRVVLNHFARLALRNGQKNIIYW